jgi:hypothetical protein
MTLGESLRKSIEQGSLTEDDDDFISGMTDLLHEIAATFADPESGAATQETARRVAVKASALQEWIDRRMRGRKAHKIEVADDDVDEGDGSDIQKSDSVQRLVALRLRGRISEAQLMTGLGIRSG